MDERNTAKFAQKKAVATILSQESGCGKSFKTRCLVQIGRYTGHEVAVFDGDSPIWTTIHRTLCLRYASRCKLRPVPSWWVNAAFGGAV